MSLLSAAPPERKDRSRAWVLSDLHVNASIFPVPSHAPDCDVIIVAGDVDEGMEKSLEWLATHLVPYGKTVIFVPGNHDFAGGQLHIEDAAIARGQALGVTVLVSGQTTIVKGVRYVGAVLWTDMAIADDIWASEGAASKFMPDYATIRVGDRNLWPRDLRELHLKHLGGIVEALSIPFQGPSVVVTHHAPHAKSLRDGKVTDLTDASFASDLTWVIEEFAPELWVHGHVHNHCDYYHSGTRVVCNPRGYVADADSAENISFDPALVLNI